MQDLHSTIYLPRAEPSTRPGGVSRSRTEPLAPRARGPAAPSTLAAKPRQPSEIQESTAQVPGPGPDPDRATGAPPPPFEPFSKEAISFFLFHDIIVQLEGIYPLWIVISIKEILPLGKVTKALAALALGAVTAYLFPRRKDSSLPVGESSYFLEDRSGTCGEPIPVYYYKPATWTEDQPVFIAFPGYTRKAERFEKHLEEPAVRYNMLIACPEISTEK